MQADSAACLCSISLFDRMIHTLWTFPSRFVSLADANETLAAQRDHALCLIA
jgi:hypothetical protein